MELYELNPHIRYARLHKESFRVRRSVSICYDCRLFYFENATGSIAIGGERHSIAHGTAIYLPPATHYHFHINFEKDTRIIILDFDLCCEFQHIKSSLGTANDKNFDPSHMPRYDLPFALSAPAVRPMPALAPLLSDCANAFAERRLLYRERASAYLKLCLLHIAEEKAEVNTQLGVRILDYVHKHFEKSNLTNEEIAAVFGYHPYHITRVVKKETGMSLRNYVIHYRLRVAKDLLLTTRHTVAEIAFRTGFCSSAYFSKTFKEHSGLSPKEYRKIHLHTEI